ncbi:hypothetical protein BDZ45DRAFT_748820 [Acephala macrosclerotiorum]|nr:hypothetical protein BDZ45DRAFT_748820 [Acephala macrosclerotiorum]
MASWFYHKDTPAEVKDAKGLHLLTTSTPNGKKVQTMLEELKKTYRTEYTHTLISIPKNTQKEDWFLRLNQIVARNVVRDARSRVECAGALDETICVSYEAPHETAIPIYWAVPF